MLFLSESYKIACSEPDLNVSPIENITSPTAIIINDGAITNMSKPTPHKSEPITKLNFLLYLSLIAPVGTSNKTVVIDAIEAREKISVKFNPFSR